MSILLLLLSPLRWYPWLRVLLALGAVASVLQVPSRRFWLFLPLSTVAAIALLRTSANLRFVACEQAPLAGALLDGVSRLMPAPRLASRRHTGRRPGCPKRCHGSKTPTSCSSPSTRYAPTTWVSARRAWTRWRHAACVFLTPTPRPRRPRSRSARCSPGTPPDRLAVQPPTLAEKLRARRWRTEAFYPAGLFFDGRGPLQRWANTRFGFEWTDTRTLDAAALTDALLARAAELRRSGEPRTFLWAHYFDAHEPYRVHPGLTRGDSPAARYDGDVAFLDRELGRLLDGLAQRMRRPVIVCLTADHGEEFGEHGGAYHNSSLYEEQVRVPLLIYAPGVEPRVIADPVELTGVMPTLLALAGDGQPPEWEHDAHAQLGTRRMLVRGRWKLIHDARRDLDELYDLSEDPREQRNRFDERADVAAPLHAALDTWFNLSPPESLERTLADRTAPPLERAAAARQLGEMEAFSARATLHHALDDPDAVVRAETALALGELSDHFAATALFSLLDSPEWRHRAAVMLGRLREPRAVPALIESLSDLSPTLRRHAAHYLGWLGGHESIAPLSAASSDVRLRAEAYLALGRIAARIHEPAIGEFLDARSREERYEDARASLAEAQKLAAAQ